MVPSTALHADTWGVVFEVCFGNEEQWEAFRNLPAVRAALDAVPDPVGGLLVSVAVVGARLPASHASRSPRRARAPSPCPSPKPGSMWI